MPIDPSIPLQIRPPQQQTDMIGRLAQLAQLRNAEQQAGQQAELTRLNIDTAKMNQGMAHLKMLSQLAADMKSLPQPERKARADRLAAAFESSGNGNLAQMLRGYEWTDQDATDLSALTADAEAQWSAASARFKALQGTPAREMEVAGVTPEMMPLPGATPEPMLLSAFESGGGPTQLEIAGAPPQPMPLRGSGIVPSSEPGPSRTLEMPMPSVAFPAREGQPAFSLRPSSAQQLARTKRAQTIQEETDKAAITAAYRAPAAIIQEWEAWQPGQPEGADISFGAFMRDRARPSFEEQTFQDYLKSPEAAKYGANRFGYDKYKQQQRIETAQASRAQVSGLPPGTAQRVGQIASQFDTHPIVKNYNEVVNKADTVQGIVENPSGPGDLAIVFEFMRALDPTSVVRESEYASAAASGNIFSGAAARFNGLWDPKGGFLSPQVKNDFLRIVQQKLAVADKQYKNVRSEYGRRIDKWTGEQDGEEYLTSYELPGARSTVPSDPLGILGPRPKN